MKLFTILMGKNLVHKKILRDRLSSYLQFLISMFYNDQLYNLINTFKHLNNRFIVLITSQCDDKIVKAK